MENLTPFEKAEKRALELAIGITLIDSLSGLIQVLETCKDHPESTEYKMAQALLRVMMEEVTKNDKVIN